MSKNRTQYSDSEPIDDSVLQNKEFIPNILHRDFREGATDKSPDSLTSLLFTALKTIHWKVAFFLFLIIILLWSDVFVEGILAKMNGMVDGQVITRKGIVAQALLVVLSYIIFSFLVSVGAL